jgi:2-C-methyl-D-erythritol 2,4-cyclodiphosphate synthase
MMRVGIGYDIHRTRENRPLVLGGVTIPSPFGLEGLSDADVVLHALMDALLGAAALGDIGHHFPPADARFRGISSLVLLARVHELIVEAGYRLVNADIVLVAERPRIAPYVDQMRRSIARVVDVEVAGIGIKATTNEGMGAEGRGEAISAHAVALLGPRR